MKIENLMTPAVFSCRTTDPLSNIAQTMWEGDLGCLPVLDGDERVVGMITDRDMLMATHLRGAALWSLTAADVMANVVHALAATDSARDALDLMARHQLRRLPVLSDAGRLLGIVSLGSLACAASNGSSPLQPREVAATLAAICSPRGTNGFTDAAPEPATATLQPATLQPAPRGKKPGKTSISPKPAPKTPAPKAPFAKAKRQKAKARAK